MSKKDRLDLFLSCLFCTFFACGVHPERWSTTVKPCILHLLTQSHSEMFSCLNEVVKQLVWNSHMKGLS